MYEAFYGFREKPFHVTADPTFLFPSRHHQEALAHLTYGIRERLGFLLITGEVGTGKTTLAKALVSRMGNPVKTALILNPALSGTELLKAILRDFGVEPGGTARGHLIQAIEQFLLQQAALGGMGVVIIDEAQALSANALEQIRLLSNVETPKTKLLQIVLVGQPELEQWLATKPGLRALNQRIAVRYRVMPLSSEEVAHYIEHRLKVAGRAEGPPCFTQEAVVKIAAASFGIPRRINLLCDRALLSGFVHGSTAVQEEMVEEILGENP